MTSEGRTVARRFVAVLWSLALVAPIMFSVGTEPVRAGDCTCIDCHYNWAYDDCMMRWGSTYCLCCQCDGGGGGPFDDTP